MKLLLALALVLIPCAARAERAKSAAEATVFVRLIGSMHAEIDEGGFTHTADVERAEIGTGSGFVISPHGYVLTNDHVVHQREPIVINRGGRRAKITLKISRIDVCFPPSAAAAAGLSSHCAEASVTATNPTSDLTVLFVNLTNLPYVAMGDSDAVAPGIVVEALGYPFGREIEVGKVVSAPDLIPEISTTRSTVSAVRSDDAGERRFLQVSGGVNPGNSGGPVVDHEGFALGVIRLRLARGEGLGFAIPINEAKDFLESSGLSHLMPARRLRVGPLQRLDPKGIALRLVEGLSDTSPYRSHVESEARTDSVTLRIDRVFSPWSLKQLERTLLGTQGFEAASFSPPPSIESAPKDSPLLLGYAPGVAGNGKDEIKMEYAILDLGEEKLVARYIGPSEQVAFNQSVLRESLATLEAVPARTAENVPAHGLEWTSASGGWVPLPAGWVVEPGGPAACAGLPPPSATTASFPAQDFTFVLRAASWATSDIVPEAAARACSASRGSLGSASYATRVEWLGVSYVTEGAFLRLNDQVVQLEVLSPERTATAARTLFIEWAKKLTP